MKTFYIFVLALFVMFDYPHIPGYDISKSEAQSMELSAKLNEISGLAFSKDGRLFAHDDERAVIYQLDIEDGKIIKKFYFGMLITRGDFEGIAIVDDTFYMVHSKGIIYQFKEGNDGGRVNYETYQTDLPKKSDVEGLCYDPKSNDLLLALKGEPGVDQKNTRAVYAFSLDDMKLKPKPRYLINTKDLKELSDGDKFAPSGIEYNPRNDSFLIISAEGHIIIEINRAGQIIAAEKLPSSVHNQAEGIALDPAGNLYIADENKKHGMLTRYDFLDEK